jgi:hypothetical protein
MNRDGLIYTSRRQPVLTQATFSRCLPNYRCVLAIWGSELYICRSPNCHQASDKYIHLNFIDGAPIGNVFDSHVRGVRRTHLNMHASSQKKLFRLSFQHCLSFHLKTKSRESGNDSKTVNSASARAIRASIRPPVPEINVIASLSRDVRISPVNAIKLAGQLCTDV